jgi:ABC-type branched-subunit amino acid transport system ATPase component
MKIPILHIDNLSVGYEKDKFILQNFSLQMNEGDRTGIVGQNGCGKSTLAKAIMGITPFTEGSIIWQGQELSKIPIHLKKNKGISYLAQGGRIFENLTVAENIKFALLDQKKTSYQDAIKNWQDKGITMIQQINRLHMKGSFLSGGEKHILSLIMVFLANPDMKLLIADEPSAGIAAGVQKQLLHLMQQQIVQKQISLILIEHNAYFLKELTNNIIKI